MHDHDLRGQDDNMFAHMGVARDQGGGVGGMGDALAAEFPPHLSNFKTLYYMHYNNM